MQLPGPYHGVPSHSPFPLQQIVT